MYSFLKGEKQDIGMALDGGVYFVAKHYRISITEVQQMTPEVFEQSFVWGMAQMQIEQEEMDKSTKDIKSESNIASGKGPGQPFPFDN